LLSGYASAENLAHIAGSAVVVAAPVGRGCVVLAPDNPIFRGFWLVGNRAFLNAIYFGAAIRPIGPPNTEDAD
jgi:hypothetical protein